MTIWIMALCFVGLGALVNFYNGALRAAFSLVGLLIASLLAMPLSGIVKPVLSLVGFAHPVGQSFLAPIIMWLAIVVVFVVASIGVHRKLDTYFKYKASETQRGLFQRMNSRVGIAVGIANGAIYAYAACVPLSVLGYFTTQAATDGKDSLTMRFITSLRRDLASTGMDKAVAPFTPSADFYYDAADVLGLIYHNPLIQSRLSSYPPFLALAEKPEFQQIAGDVQFQEYWQKEPHPPIQELAAHERVKPLVDSIELYTNSIALLGGDLKDLKAYLETGKSPKYGEETILGRWHFSYRDSMLQTRRSKANWNSVELNRIKKTLSTGWPEAVLTAMIDNEVAVKLSAGGGLKAKWTSLGGGRYTIQLADGGKNAEIDARVEGNRLSFAREGVTLVFTK